MLKALKQSVILSAFCVVVLLLASVGEASCVHSVSRLDGGKVCFPYDEAYLDFIKQEQANDFVVQGEVDPKYQPQQKVAFDLPFILMPTKRLTVVEATEYKNSYGPHMFFKDPSTGEQMVRFFIHPESQEFYKSLIEEFGVSGNYIALPTSSTRTLLAWDPTRPELEPVFIKTSLAKQQTGLGRILPAWEVERSVGVTKLIKQSAREWQESGADLIPEVAGVYVSKKEGLAFYVDDDQPNVMEHGYLLRDASFIKQYKDKLVMPLFGLFVRRGDGAPLIVELWEKSGVKDFEVFVREYLIDPFVKKNLYTILWQGIAPQMHGQNVVLILNPKTYKIEHIKHRDLGSFKTDYRLRWNHGLSTVPLRGGMADKTFGLSWSYENIERYFISYFWFFNFANGYVGNLSEFVEYYNSVKIKREVIKSTYAQIHNQLNRWLEAKRAVKIRSSDIQKMVRDYLNFSPVPQSGRIKTIPITDELKKWLKLRRIDNQVVSEKEAFPSGWSKRMRLGYDEALVTRYGLLYRGMNEKIHMVFYEYQSQEQELIHLTKNSCQSAIAI